MEEVYSNVFGIINSAVYTMLCSEIVLQFVSDYKVFDVTSCLFSIHTTRQLHKLYYAECLRSNKIECEISPALYILSMRDVIAWASYRATLSTLYLVGNNWAVVSRPAYSDNDHRE